MSEKWHLHEPQTMTNDCRI